MARALHPLRGMDTVHFTTRMRTGLLFDDWSEAADLWRRIIGAVAEVDALVLMPNHIHLLAPADRARALGHALSAYTRSRRHRAGPALEPTRVSPIADPKHLRRTRRYLALNPCRARLVSDPLAWPFSTYRDELGLAWPPVRRAVPDPEALHAEVSSDPSVAICGTPFPAFTLRAEPDAEALRAIASEIMRLPLPHRETAKLSARLARDGQGWSARRGAEAFGLSKSSVAGLPDVPPPLHRIAARMVADPRFPGLLAGYRPWAMPPDSGHGQSHVPSFWTQTADPWG